MNKLIIAGLALIALIACNKDKFQTKPQITIRDYSSKEISQGGTLEVRLNYTDKEGDVGQGSFFGARLRQNIRALNPTDNDQLDTLRYSLPEMPDIDKGVIVMKLDYNFLKESLTENDTIVFKIAIKDRAGNASDTLTTDKLVIKKD
jgi:hypothetical protein